MNAALQSTDAQWRDYYAANAATYRALAEVCRREAQAYLLRPFGDDATRRSLADRKLAEAEDFERKAREQMEDDA